MIAAAWLGALAAMLVAALATGRLARPGSSLVSLDLPNERSLHYRPIPRGGGLGIIAGVLAGLLVATGLGAGPGDAGGASVWAWVAAAAALVGGVSYLDDRRHVPAPARLCVHLLASALLLGGGLAPAALALPGLAIPLPGWAGAVLALLFATWMVNLYNFMDGMDGFAGGMAVAGFGCLGVLAVLAGDALLAAPALAVAGAAFGFLRHNFPPARIFMGDVGASVLGLLAAALALAADARAVAPLWVSVLIFSPFVVDASVTLAARGLRGERVWEAHKTHCYQRLVEAGWGHRRTVLAEYALMAACAAAALAVVHLAPLGQWCVAGAFVILYTVLIARVRRVCGVRGGPDTPDTHGP